MAVSETQDTVTDGQNPAIQAVSPATQKDFKCEFPDCGKSFDTAIALRGHQRSHEAQKRREELEREHNRRPEEIYRDIKIEGLPAFKKLLRMRLEEALTMPQVPPESKQYALQEWDNSPYLGERTFDASGFYRCLKEDAGIKPEKAQRIIEKLVFVFNEYAQALQESGGMVPQIVGGFGSAGQDYGFSPLNNSRPPFNYVSYPTQQYPAQQFFPSSSVPGSGMIPIGAVIIGYDSFGRPMYGLPQQQQASRELSEEKVQLMIRSSIETAVKDTAARIDAISKEHTAQFNELKSLIAKQPEDKNSGKRYRASKGDIIAEGSTPQEAAMNLRMLLLDFEHKNETPPGKSPELVAMENEIAAQTRKITTLSEQLKTAEAERRADQIKNLEDKIAEAKADKKELEAKIESIRNRPVDSSGWHSDEGKILGSAIDKLGSVVERKEPLDKITTLVKDILISPQPTATTQSPELEALAQAGYVDQS